MWNDHEQIQFICSWINHEWLVARSIQIECLCFSSSLLIVILECIEFWHSNEVNFCNDSFSRILGSGLFAQLLPYKSTKELVIYVLMSSAFVTKYHYLYLCMMYLYSKIEEISFFEVRGSSWLLVLLRADNSGKQSCSPKV